MQRFEVGLARIDAAARQRPDGARGELEAHQQDVAIGGDEQRANSLTDAQFGHRTTGQSFGMSRRPSLNALYIS